MLPERKKIRLNKDSKSIKDHEWVRSSFNHVTSTGKAIDLRKLDSNHIRNILAKAQRDENYALNCGLSNLNVFSMELIYRKIHGINKEKKITVKDANNGIKPNKRSL